MEIKKFEAYNYRGPELKDLTRGKFLEEIIDVFMDQKLFGYEVGGSSFDPKEEILQLNIYNHADEKIIKLDLSDIGIEIGTQEIDEDGEPVGNFKTEVNLDTENTRQMKKYKGDIKKYNI